MSILSTPMHGQPMNSTAAPSTTLLARLAAWRYAGERRDQRLDLLRGFAAFVMVADHVGAGQSWLYALTGGNQFVVSAAEAFVLISGVVLGIVYARVVQTSGIATALMKALHRAWMLYVMTVALTLGFAALSAVLRLPWAPELRGTAGLRFAIEVLTLHRTMYLADVLLMYTFLLLLAGPVVLLLSQGRTAVVLAGSWLVWALWQFVPASATLLWIVEGNEVFHLSPWQVIFVTGIVIGWHRPSIEAWLAGRSRARLRAAFAVALFVVGTLYALQLTRLDALHASPLLAALAFDKPDLAVGRLIVLAILSVVAFELLTLAWTPVHRLTGWLLLPLGEHALAAYSLHIFLVALVARWYAWWPFDGIPIARAAIPLATVMVVWLAVRSEAVVARWLASLAPRRIWIALTAAGSLQEKAGESHA